MGRILEVALLLLLVKLRESDENVQFDLGLLKTD